MPGRIPNLELNRLAVLGDVAHREEVGADGRVRLARELFVHVPVQQLCFANRARPDQKHVQSDELLLGTRRGRSARLQAFHHFDVRESQIE